MSESNYCVSQIVGPTEHFREPVWGSGVLQKKAEEPRINFSMMTPFLLISQGYFAYLLRFRLKHEPCREPPRLSLFVPRAWEVKTTLSPACKHCIPQWCQQEGRAGCVHKLTGEQSPATYGAVCLICEYRHADPAWAELFARCRSMEVT